MKDGILGPLVSSPMVVRHPGNPVLAASDVPFPATLVFNAGVAKFDGRYVMIFRNDVCERDPFKSLETNLGLAESVDGVRWTVHDRPVLTQDDARRLGAKFYANRGGEMIRRIYDPRITILDGVVHLCFAVDTPHGVRGGIAVTDDFERYEFISMSAPDNRNMVLLPDRIGDRAVRLERPFPVYGRPEAETFDIWIADSTDLIRWGNHDLVLGVEDVPFSNGKIGPGAPPVRTEKGWLTLFHATDVDPSRGKNGWEETWKKRYTVGIMLLDLDNPAKVIGLSRAPLMAPEAPYEVDEGFRTSVLFPGGMILEPDGEVKIYYGAADTVECLATASVDDLLSLVTRP